MSSRAEPGCDSGTCAQVGRLWTSLADYYIRQGMYESARDVYEEGLTTVTTVRDFSLIFDTLTQFEETLLQHKVRALASLGGRAFFWVSLTKYKKLDYKLRNHLWYMLP